MKKRCRLWCITPRSSSRSPNDFARSIAERFSVPECQTRVDLFPEYRDGKMHFYADLNVRQSPTIAAFLAILFSAINDQPPATTLAIPDDFVQQLMEGIGLSGREVGLNAMVSRIKQHARETRRHRNTEHAA